MLAYLHRISTENQRGLMTIAQINRLRLSSLLVILLAVTAGCSSMSNSSVAPSPTSAPLATATPLPTATLSLTLDQRIDAYVGSLSTAQLIGQILMLAVYAPSDTVSLNQALASYHI